MKRKLEFKETKEKFLKGLLLKNYAETTIQIYRRVFVTFEAYLKKINKVDLRTLTTGDLQSYQTGILEKPWAPATREMTLARMKVFFKYLFEKQFIWQDLAQGIQVPARQRRLPKVLTLDEIATLLAIPIETKKAGLRDKAILELLYSSGLRASEVCNLDVMDIDFENGCVFVARGKGSKDRLVPVGRKALLALKDYLVKQRHHFEKRPHQRTRCPRSPKLFLNVKGMPLTLGTFEKMFEWRKRLAVIRKRVYPHLIRHTMATHLLESGANIRVVQEILGHRDLSTTTLYTHLDKSDLRRIHHKYHPRAKWRFTENKKMYFENPLSKEVFSHYHPRGKWIFFSKEHRGVSSS